MDNSEFDREVSDIIIFAGFGFDGYGDGHYYGDGDGNGFGDGLLKEWEEDSDARGRGFSYGSGFKRGNRMGDGLGTGFGTRKGGGGVSNFSSGKKK